VAASTAPVIRIRAPAANSISIDPPLLAGVTGQGVGPDSATTIAGSQVGGRHTSAQPDRDTPSALHSHATGQIGPVLRDEGELHIASFPK
jgi:hypothetical protein